ncbi:MAG: TIGR01777 family oxidoreductase [Ilumatobacteraceae bacterium]
MRILISGASGLIGSALSNHLSGDGHTVLRLVRRDAKAGEFTWDPSAGKLDPAAFDGCDAVINLSGAGIGDKRWTDDYKAQLMSSRLQATELLATTIAALDELPSVFLSGSAVGWYGDRGDERLDELSVPGSDFLSDLCQRWEAATLVAEKAGVRTVHLRTGVVLSAKGGALKKQLPLFKLGLGGRFGSGHQWQSWISIDDEVGAIAHLLSAEICGPVNLTAPEPVTNLEFTTTLAKVLHRPAVLPVPMFGPKLMLGGELVESLLLSSQRVVPTALQRSAYEFHHPTLEAALRDILHRT